MSTSMVQSSSRCLKELTDHASTTNAGSLFHVLTTLCLKKHCLSCSLQSASIHLQLSDLWLLNSWKMVIIGNFKFIR